MMLGMGQRILAVIYNDFGSMAFKAGNVHRFGDIRCSVPAGCVCTWAMLGRGQRILVVIYDDFDSMAFKTGNLHLHLGSCWSSKSSLSYFSRLVFRRRVLF
jgi:hypothetical protein